MVWQLAALVVLLACSGFFSGSETALFNLTLRDRRRFASGGRLERLALRLLERPDRLLVTLLLGNMAVNVLFFAISSVTAYDISRQASGWVTTLAGIAPLVAIILFGEVVPKSIALAHAARVAPLIAPGVWLVDRALAPVRGFLQTAVVGPFVRLLSPEQPAEADIRPEELKLLLETSARQGHIEVEVGGLLEEVIELASIKVRDVMVPRADVVGFDIDRPRDDLVRLIEQTRRRRIPVYREGLDHLLGVVRSHDVLVRENVPLERLLHPPLYVPEVATCDHLLQTFKERGEELAFAVDEYGGVAGLVTLRDVVEEIVGDIAAGEDELPELVKPIGPGTYLVAGHLSVREWAEAFRLPVPRQQVRTVAGLMAWQLGRWPRAGDSIRIRNLRLTVHATRGRRVTLIRLELLNGHPETAHADPDRPGPPPGPDEQETSP